MAPSVKLTRPGIRVGVLGDGQLARMLIQSGQRLGLDVHVLSQNPNSPAAQVTKNVHLGSLSELGTLRTFLNAVDLCTFESEFVDTEILTVASQTTSAQIFPRLGVMQVMQDRAQQKVLLVDHKIKTSPFGVVQAMSEMESVISELGLPLVLKKRRNGYDGYGTYYLNKKEDALTPLMAGERDGFIAESFVKFKRELAISAVRSLDGKFLFLPLVESQQKDSKCFWVKGPIKHPKLSALQRQIAAFMKKINYVGVLAFELFDTGRDLIVNELAPRVHNSAHYSMDALLVDQFQLHWLAGLGENLPPAVLKNQGFAMVNLIGANTSAPSWKTPQASSLHWYGKLENRPGRKMGHLNVVAKTSDGALRAVLKDLKGFQL